MKKIILIISMLILLLPVVSAVQVDMTSDVTKVKKNEEFIVEITLDTQGENITTWAINTLTYSNADVLNVTINDVWKSNGFWDVMLIDNQNHTIKNAGAFIMTGVNGTYQLCNITFKGTDKGDCNIIIEKGYIRNKKNDNFDIEDFLIVTIEKSEDTSNNGGGGSPPPYNPPPPIIEENKIPHAIIDIPTKAKTYEILDFNASESYDEDGDIVSYLWNIDDIYMIQNKTYFKKVFDEAGNYTISLTITDDDGDSNTTSKIIEITENESYIPNQDNNQTNDTQPNNQNNTNQNTSDNKTKVEKDDNILIQTDPLHLLFIAIFSIVMMIIYKKYIIWRKK